jgi:hypothetical protein
MSSANRDSLTIYLPICIPFTSFCVIAFARIYRTMLNRKGENEHPCLIPDIRVNGFSFSPVRIMLAVGLSHIVFIMLRYIPSVPSFPRASIMKCCLVLLRLFLHLLR